MSNFATYNFNNATAGTILKNYTNGTGETGGGWVESSAIFFIVDDLVITGGGRVRANAIQSNLVGYLVNTDASADDVSVSADFYVASDTAYAAILARCNNTTIGDGYIFQYRPFHGWQLLLLSGNAITAAATEVPFTPTVGETYTVNLQVTGSNPVALVSYVQRLSDGLWFNPANSWQAGQVAVFNTTDATTGRIAGDTSHRKVGIGIQATATPSDTANWQIDNFNASVIVPTLTPGTLSSTGQTYDTASLSWTAASGGSAPVTTQLQRSASGANSWSNVSGGTSSPFTDTGLVRSTAYDYRVAYTDSQPSTVYSNVITVTTDANPTTPELTVKNGATTVGTGSTYDFGGVNQQSAQTLSLTLNNTGGQTLTLGSVSATAGVTISTDPSGDSLAVSGNTSLVLSLNTASAGSVSSTLSVPSNDPLSPFTLIITATVNSIYPPGAPSSLTGSSMSGTSASLSWTNADSTDTGIVVERSTDNVTFVVLATTAAHTTSYTDSTVAGGTTYYYRVKATNANGDSGYSNVVRVDTPVVGAPLAPANFTATVQTDTDVNLMWDRSDTTENYFEIQRSSDGGVSWTSMAAVGSRENTVNDNSCYPSTTYKYRIRGVNDLGQGAFSTVVTVTMPVSGASLSPITGLTVTAVDSWTTTISWTDPNSATSMLERSFDGYFFQPVNPLVFASGGPKTDPYLPAGSSVYYRVRSQSGAGGRTDYTPAVGATLPARPSGAPLEPGEICINTYLVSLGGATSGTFTLTINTVDYARQPVSATTTSLAYNASAAQIQAALRNLGVLPYGSQVYVGGLAGNWVVGFSDGYSVLAAGSSSLTGGSLAVTEKQTGTNTTIVFSDPNGAGTTYHVESSGTNYGYFTFSEVGTVAGDSTGAISFDFMTVPESNYYLRVRASVGSVYSGYAKHVRVCSPSPGSAVTAHCGPGQTYATPVALDWTTLGPGSTVYIHTNVDGSNNAIAWNYLLYISCRGTPGKPIKIIGVNGGNVSVPPIIDGTGGLLDNSLGNEQFRSNYLGSGVGDPGFQGHCVCFGRRAGSNNTGYCPGYITLSNFELRFAYVGNGSFTGWGQSGNYPATISYWSASCGVYFASGDYITIDKNTIHNCSEGIFGAGGHNDPVPYTDNRSLSFITIQYNYMYGNGVVNNFLSHNSYLEGLYTYYVGNKYGALRASAQGNHGAKDRGAGTVFLFNWFDDGVAHCNDIVETQNYFNVVFYMPEYRYTVCLGNVYNMQSSTQDFIHYAGDGGYTPFNRKGVLYAMYNTFILNATTFKSALVKNVDNNNNDPTSVVDMRNNIFWYTSTSGGLDLIFANGIGYFGKNWITMGFTTGYAGDPLYVGGLSNLVVGSSANDPGFVNQAGADYHLTGSSVCKDAAVDIPGFITSRWPLTREYLDPTQTAVRPTAGGTFDLGAFEYYTGTMTADITSLERGASGQVVNLTGSGTSFTGTPFIAHDQSGNTVTISTQTVTDATHAQVTLTAPNTTGRVIIIDNNSGAAVSLSVADTTVPTFVSASVAADGSGLTVTFSETVQDVFAADFDLGSSNARSLGSPTGTGSSRVFPLSPKGFQGETYTVSYSGSRAEDLYGNLLSPFTSQAVTNNSSLVADYVAPAVPTGLVVIPGAGTNVLTWTANGESDLASYNVYRNDILAANVVKPTTTYTDLGLTSGTSYSYKLTAVDSNGNESTASGSVAGTPDYPPPPSPSVTVKGVNLSWGVVSVPNGPASYIVESSDDGGTTWTQLAPSVVGTTFYDSSGTASRKYRIKTRDTANNIAPSPVPVKIATAGNVVVTSRRVTTGRNR